MDIANFLIRDGSDVNVTLDAGEIIPQVTPLHLAAYSGGCELIKVLAEKGNVNVEDQVCCRCYDMTLVSQFWCIVGIYAIALWSCSKA